MTWRDEAQKLYDVDSVGATCPWVCEGTRFEGRLIRSVVNVPEDLDAGEFFLQYKERLKQRFRQIDIWITSHTVNVI